MYMSKHGAEVKSIFKEVTTQHTSSLQETVPSSMHVKIKSALQQI
jgi:hypothetical protein